MMDLFTAAKLLASVSREARDAAGNLYSDSPTVVRAIRVVEQEADRRRVTERVERWTAREAQLASCGCYYHAEGDIPCEHDVDQQRQDGERSCIPNPDYSGTERRRFEAALAERERIQAGLRSITEVPVCEPAEGVARRDD